MELVCISVAVAGASVAAYGSYKQLRHGDSETYQRLWTYGMGVWAVAFCVYKVLGY